MKQSLCLDFAQCLTLEPDNKYALSYIPRTSKAIDANGLREALDHRARKEGYRCADDLFLIMAFPDEKEGCLRYYREEGPDLAGLHTPSWLRMADCAMASSIRPMLDRIIGPQRSVADFYEGVIYPWYGPPVVRMRVHDSLPE